MSSRSRSRVLAALLGGAWLAACSGASPEPVATSDGDARIDAIVEARAQVVEPAQALGTAAAGVTAALEDLIARPDEAALARLDEATTELTSATEAVDDLQLDDDTEDLRAADGALEDASSAAASLRGAVEEVAEAAEQAAELDDRLDAWVAAWDEPGSRSELLARFDELAAEAVAAADGSERTPPSCAGPVDARREAAAFVADATEELRGFVAAYDGNGFDARRAELDEAPFGLDDAGVVRGPGASIDPANCPAVDDAEAAATDVAAALRALQAALNPADLAG